MNIPTDDEKKAMRRRRSKLEANLAERDPPKGKSCKGYLYYSSKLKYKEKNPRCVGIPHKIEKVPNYIAGKSEAAASKDGSALADFYYGCLGYSVYMTEKDTSSLKQSTKTQLPSCVGLELLVDRRAAFAGASAPAHVQHKEDAGEIPQPRAHRPAPSRGDDFFDRFTRNANLVAAGVAKNMKRVGNHIKETVNDVLYPYGKRPK